MKHLNHVYTETFGLLRPIWQRLFWGVSRRLMEGGSFTGDAQAAKTERTRTRRTRRTSSTVIRTQRPPGETRCSIKTMQLQIKDIKQKNAPTNECLKEDVWFDWKKDAELQFVPLKGSDFIFEGFYQKRSPLTTVHLQNPLSPGPGPAGGPVPPAGPATHCGSPERRRSAPAGGCCSGAESSSLQNPNYAEMDPLLCDGLVSC